MVHESIAAPQIISLILSSVPKSSLIATFTNNKLSNNHRTDVQKFVYKMSNQLFDCISPRHLRRGKAEPVEPFTGENQAVKLDDWLPRRLERIFCPTYGYDKMLAETRDTLLHGQLQEGLRDHLIEAPAVSGAST